MICRFPNLLLFCVGLYACGTLRVPPAMAAVQEVSAETLNEFPMPSAVRSQVRFWEKIFGEYPSTSLVIHDAEDPARIVDVIDFTVFGKTSSGIVPRRNRAAIADNYVKRYQLAVTRFQTYGRAALKYGAIEKRLFKVFGRHPTWLKRLYQGEVSLRAQTGLADDFINATALAQAYFPYMEAVFRSHGVPEKVTRLAFVESMFNTKALSKVGASGVWQFMPATARNYMRVNQLVDERNSIYKSTTAAARLLKDNYKILKSWPLAITAYNHGPKGLRQAINSVGSNDIGRIVSSYRSRSFGFASRNFYAEFLAASNVYDRTLKSGRAKSVATIPQTRALILDGKLSIDQLLRDTPLVEADLRNHNPCLKPAAFENFRNKALPKQYEIYVPAHLAAAIDYALREGRKTYARR